MSVRRCEREQALPSQKSGDRIHEGNTGDGVVEFFSVAPRISVEGPLVLPGDFISTLFSPAHSIALLCPR